MTAATDVLTWATLVVLGVSLPLAAIAAWGYRTAPVGRAVAALPAVGVGLLLAASADTLDVSLGSGLTLWHAGMALATLAMAWVAVSYFAVVSGWRRIGR